ncbi:dolichyl-phosphate beta-D-mannosyltransferase [Methanocella sp. CWC-04]|uniref:Dolichyl-phosphate beta-D-mannosyltransferase n=1 Tax=Methanooceanicella nereidis TaxID=2052831 RepID=A0AAP2W765_9EURY|nr:glycosyltransferase family 2 protein [Methanocella sp. CWC-04]MCD1294914.1 dolichyl-phosphate beta-D-mannosyltransferase [Methanocella sp. CWC-04]
MVLDIQGRDTVTAGTEKPVRSIGIIYHRLNYLTIGSVIAATKNYVDKVYVILENYDDRVVRISSSLGAEIVDPMKHGYASAYKRIISESNADVFVALYGDGSHDPESIPELFEHLNSGYDIAISSSSGERYSMVNETILYLNNKKPRSKNNGFVAFSSKSLDKIDLGVLNFEQGNIIDKLSILSINSGLKVKTIHTDDQIFGLFNLYKIGVVVPAYNEELLIEETINSIPEYVDKIYLIDDCSTDRMPEIVAKMTDPRLVKIRHEVNKGVGAAIINGYKRALEDEMDMVAVMAGDNQMDPEQLPRLLIPIIEGRADYTKGNRLISKDFRKGMSKWRSFGNFILTMLTKIASGYWSVTDPQNGYTVISKQALEALDIDAVYTYYGYCNDILVKLNAFGMRTLDIPMPSRYGREKSKIKYSRYIRKVSPMLFKGFLWRLKTKYILLDFNPLVLFYAASMIMVPFGLLFCMCILAEKILHNYVSPNFPLLAVFITLIGLQFLMFAMLFDMQADRSINRF